MNAVEHGVVYQANARVTGTGDTSENRASARRLVARLLPDSTLSIVVRFGHPTDRDCCCGMARVIRRSCGGPQLRDEPVYLTRNYRYLDEETLVECDLLVIAPDEGGYQHVYAFEPADAAAALADAQRRFDARQVEKEAQQQAERRGWCVVRIDGGWEVLQMRVSFNGNLCDCGGHHRWPGGMYHFGDDESRWPVIHATCAEAEAELAEKWDACEHDWRFFSHEENRCEHCGCFQSVLDL